MLITQRSQRVAWSLGGQFDRFAVLDGPIVSAGDMDIQASDKGYGAKYVPWVKITKPGVYYGQCSELCGVNHGFMPIAVKAVSKEDFKKWTVEAKKEFARIESVPVQTPVKVAQAKDAIR